VSDRPRLVLDTNVVVSGTLSAGGPSGQLLRAFRNDVFDAVVCDALICEYAQVLSRPRFPFAGLIAADMVSHFSRFGPWMHELRDPGVAVVDRSDQPFYDCAFTTGCALVTGNLKHFPPDGPVEVLSPREAVERLIQP
jgi:uncharacterized protein